MAPSIEAIDIPNIPKAYFAPATVTQGSSRLIHVSGQVGNTKDNHVPADYESQIHLALLNLRKILILAGATVKDIAKLTLYIVNYDPTRRKHTRHIQRFLKGHRPAITLVPVTQLAAPNWLFEVEAVVVCPEQTLPPRLLSNTKDESADVIIIGAGLAGLSAAQKALQAGLSCIILEARDRVGGKLWSQPMSKGKGMFELGAAWINDVNQTKMIELARRFGLDLIEQNTTGNCVMQDSEGKISPFPYGELPRFDSKTVEDVARIRDLCEADCQTLNVFEPKNTQLDAITFDAYLRSNGASDTSIATATVWTRAMLGLDPADMSALYFLNYCKSGGGLLQMRSDRKGGGQHLRIRQGTQSIATNLAAVVGSEKIRLNTPVKNVIQDGSEVKVMDALGSIYHARKVITTVPSPALKSIDFTPKLHPVKQTWSESASYGYYTKAIVAFKTPFWIEKGFCGLCQSFTGPASVVRDTSSPIDNKHTLTCFMVGPPGEEWAKMPSAQRDEKLLSQLGTLFGDYNRVKQDFIEIVMYDWTQDKWSGGGCPCTSLSPGVLDTMGPGALRKSQGNLHFAGTETAGEWKGYMEGAVRSGERAAEEVIDALAIGFGPRL